MSKPKRHHYIPQFFSKDWRDEKGYLSMFDKNDEDRPIKVKTENFGLEKNLYKLNSEIESLFITPFIDNLSSSIKEVKTRKWCELSEKVKNDFFKFIILLDARNPISINSIIEGVKPYKKNLLKILNEKFSISEKINNEISSGLDNGVLIFMMIAMQEIGIKEEDLNKVNNKDMREVSMFCFKLVELANYYLPKSYYFDRFYESFYVDEFICEKNRLITSDRGISRKGAYDKNFTLLISVSPSKGYFISNEKGIIDNYNRCNSDDKVIFFNDSIKKFSTKFIIKK